MIADPTAHPHADCSDLVFAAATSIDPDADTIRPPLARNIEGSQRFDYPGLKITYESAHVAASLLQVEHDVGDPLAGSVIGELPAAPCAVDRKTVRLQEVRVPGAGSGGVERRMFQ